MVWIHCVGKGKSSRRFTRIGTDQTWAKDNIHHRDTEARRNLGAKSEGKTDHGLSGSELGKNKRPPRIARRTRIRSNQKSGGGLRDNPACFVARREHPRNPKPGLCGAPE